MARVDVCNGYCKFQECVVIWVQDITEVHDLQTHAC